MMAPNFPKQVMAAGAALLAIMGLAIVALAMLAGALYGLRETDNQRLTWTQSELDACKAAKK